MFWKEPGEMIPGFFFLWESADNVFSGGKMSLYVASPISILPMKHQIRNLRKGDEETNVQH